MPQKLFCITKKVALVGVAAKLAHNACLRKGTAETLLKLLPVSCSASLGEPEATGVPRLFDFVCNDLAENIWGVLLIRVQG